MRLESVYTLDSDTTYLDTHTHMHTTVAPRFKNMGPPEGSPLKGPNIGYIAF